MEEVLDRSGMLKIFTDGILIDKCLPKWQVIEKLRKEKDEKKK